MLFSYYLFVVFFLFIHNIVCFLNIFTRSASSQLKEKCGHSILLNNNYWLLKQTHLALKAIHNKELTFDVLPWNRLSISIQQIYNACLVDDMKHLRERMYIHKATLKAGTLVAKKVTDISHPTLINIVKK
ncbi:unnamed protein product [Rotaria sp. Silwood2]|nr:unnamed protein product [Rotaria sp. Silwood2]CAF2647139.1 unnamed protein product [Rotaria sp. Silwood2]CAF2866608.1 unnamed protein product [Rotaria sp. Silwood2]CAF3040219.1 unnamed protein product [Rotaria sp. Silwood2]CAF3910483.1 unnamed protein product [Rotaria sp. Silwood2]